MDYLTRLPNRVPPFLFAVVVAGFFLGSASFRTSGNFENILAGCSHVAILAVGETFPLLLRGIDLGVGSIMALFGMVAFDGNLIFGLPGQIVIPVARAVATLAGAVNGVLIAKLRLQPFVATLATMAACRCLTYMISGRQLVPGLSTKAISDFLGQKM